MGLGVFLEYFSIPSPNGKLTKAASPTGIKSDNFGSQRNEILLYTILIGIHERNSTAPIWYTEQSGSMQTKANGSLNKNLNQTT